MTIKGEIEILLDEHNGEVTFSQAKKEINGLNENYFIKVKRRWKTIHKKVATPTPVTAKKKMAAKVAAPKENKISISAVVQQARDLVASIGRDEAHKLLDLV